MTEPPIRTLAADLRDVEAYHALLVRLAALEHAMRDSVNAWTMAAYWAEQLKQIREACTR